MIIVCLNSELSAYLKFCIPTRYSEYLKKKTFLSTITVKKAFIELICFNNVENVLIVCVLVVFFEGQVFISSEKKKSVRQKIDPLWNGRQNNCQYDL